MPTPEQPSFPSVDVSPGAGESGIALVPAGAVARGVTNQGCVALARAVLADSRLFHRGAAADGGAAEHAGVRGRHDDAAWARAAHDPAVSAWLDGLRRTARGAASEPGGAAGSSLTGQLAAAVVAGERRSAEGELLLDILAAIGDEGGPADRFGQAVAEARLEAVRELAYGAGHEINNPLANIAARAQSLLPDERDPERRRRLSTIVDQAFRARDMIGGLMVFARPPRPRTADVGIDDVVRPAVDAMRPLASARGVRLEYSPPPSPLSVRVDATQVAEAIRAIAVNACEAVDDGGRVVVEAAEDAERGLCHVVIADNGRGMAPEVVRRAFDPFFSGRDAGRGIGLGLPKALRLIESSGGTVRVDSRVGSGTRVTVALPLAAAVS
jgi:signal transduction histidine kinase